jgi:hypothetical protein
MRYSFGWWDYIDGSVPTMKNRDTGERVTVRAPAPPEFTNLAVEVHSEYVVWQARNWAVLEYHCTDELGGDYYSCMMNWDRERHCALLDYTLLSDLSGRIPPYFVWSKADDCFSDAFLAWPRIGLFRGGGRDAEINTIGGWSNSLWNRDLLSREVFSSPLETSEGMTLTQSSEGGEYNVSPEQELIEDNFSNSAELTSGTGLEQLWGADFGRNGSRSSPARWRFYSGDLAGLKTRPGADLVVPYVGRFESMLTNKEIVCALASDGSRALMPHYSTACNPGVLFRFLYVTNAGTEHSVEIAGDKLRVFSLDPLWEPRGSGADLRISPSACSFLRRDIVDALLAWSGTNTPIHPGWLRPELRETPQYQLLTQLKPVQSVGAFIGKFAGYSCQGRLKTVWIKGSKNG